jgi:hypothetical protein
MRVVQLWHTGGAAKALTFLSPPSPHVTFITQESTACNFFKKKKKALHASKLGTSKPYFRDTINAYV